MGKKLSLLSNILIFVHSKAINSEIMFILSVRRAQTFRHKTLRAKEIVSYHLSFINFKETIII